MIDRRNRGAARRWTRCTAIALAAGLSLVAAACGSDDDGATNATSATTAASSSSTPATTPGASTTAGGSTPTTGADTSTQTTAARTDVTDDELDLDATVDITWQYAPTNLDPHQEASSSARQYWYQSYDTLFDILSGVPEPRLATGTEVSPDGLTTTLTLRDDVEFSDGSTLDAAAVKANLDQVRTDGGPAVISQVAAITDVTVVDPHTVAITTNIVMPELTAILGGPAGAIVNPLALADPAKLATTTAGSGPYQVTEMVPDVKVVYERSSVEYWDPDAAKVAGFTIWYTADAQAAMNGLQSGQYDAVYMTGDLGQMQTVADRGGYEIHDVVSPGAEVVYIRNTRGQLGDVKVREALARAIDKEAVSQAVYGGHCAVAAQSAPETDPLHVDGYDPYPYDPDKARALLQEAGAEHMPLELFDNATTATLLTSQVLQQMFDEVGIDATITQAAPGASPEFRDGKHDTFITGNPMLAHPLLSVSRYYLPGFFNLAGTEAAPLQALVDEARQPGKSEADLDGIYQEMGKEIGRLALAIPICTISYYMMTEPTIVNSVQKATATTIDLRYIGVLKG